jgi:Cytochrome P460
VLLTLASSSARRIELPVMTVSASEQGDAASAPIYGVTIPSRYRDWTLISVARVGGPVNDMRAKLGNDVAISAYREGKLPFPDGTIIARLAWNQATSEENNNAVRGVLERRLRPEAVQKLLAESFVAGAATNVQFMVKDSTKYASTGGWGFAQFTDDKPDGEAVHNTCFPCHAPAKDRDFVFTRYSR